MPNVLSAVLRGMIIVLDHVFDKTRLQALAFVKYVKKNIGAVYS